MAENICSANRRTLLAGLAATPVAGLPAVGAASPSRLSPPLAAALKRHREASDAWWAVSDDDRLDYWGDITNQALDRLVRTPCADERELLVKLRYLLAAEARLHGAMPIRGEPFWCVPHALAIHSSVEA
jgi:hypothetical protein